MDKKTNFNSLVVIAFFFVILAIIPLLLPNPFLLSILINILLLAYLGQCWNILGGYGGYLSLGHTVFFGIGAYTSSLFFVHLNLTPYLGMLIGSVFAGAVGLFLGYLSFRFSLRGIFFAMITLAFGFIFNVVFNNVRTLGAAQGIVIPLQKPSLLNYQFSSKTGFYYIGLVMLMIVLVITLFFEKHRFGLNLLALRDNEDAAEALGIDTNRCKVWATGLSAFLTAWGGTFYAQYLSYISPDTVFSVDVSVQMLLTCIVGGMGTLIGPTLGAFLITAISEITRFYFGNKVIGLHVFIYGVILIIFCLGLPRGIIPSIRLSIRSRKNA